MKSTRTLVEVNLLIAELCEELDILDQPKSQLLIDVDDEDAYQNNLELGWHRAELGQRLSDLEDERGALWEAERQLSHPEEYNVNYEDMKDENDLNAFENQSTEQ